FDALTTAIKKCGPVKVLPEKTRIAFQVRMSFIAVQVRRSYLVGHFVFARQVKHPRFTRVETFSPRNHLHAFRLESLAELDDEFAGWIREAYAVGGQKHLTGNPRKISDPAQITEITQMDAHEPPRHEDTKTKQQ